jgi:signal transduction histidine kinase
MISIARNRALPGSSRLILMAGFGGLLLLMAFAEFDGMQALTEIQRSNDEIREGFLRRTRVLDRIRADLYVSGTYVRDYLLEPEGGKAEGHRYSLLESRGDMDAALDEYRKLVIGVDARPIQVLTQNLAAYWSVLEPVFAWSTDERRRHGYIFLRDEVFPRRTAMLVLADQIRALNEAQLNSGRVKVESTFSQFRRRLTLILGLTIGLGLLLAAASMKRILGLENQTAANLEEILHAREELKALSARLVEAQEEERRSISRELHDEVGQALAGVLVEMANLSTLIRDGKVEAMAEKAAGIKHEVENSIVVVRNMALLLRPSMLDDLGLIAALEWQSREVSKRSGVWVKVSADRVSDELPEEHKTCIYRIVQEALHNCEQHSGALQVEVAVRQEQDCLRLAIRDDGHGFDPRRQRGMGLLGIEERVNHLDGSFTVESSPGSGTSIEVVLPLRRNAPPRVGEVA